MSPMKLNPLTRSILLVILITGIAYLLFYPILNNTFLSDDYFSLYRISIEKRILFKEFLRPMIDITFYLNYAISGMNPGSYYLFNVIVHIANTYLLYKLAKKYILFEGSSQEQFALLSSFLFLIYPFHNEGIVWLSGRLSSLACLFALISLNSSVSFQKNNLKIILPSFFYIMGLLCYESIILLPIIIIILTWDKAKPRKNIIWSMIVWFLITSLYLFVRYTLSEEIYGDYGHRMIEGSMVVMLLKFLKTTGRLFLPPFEDSNKLVIIFSIVILFLLLIHLKLFQKNLFKNVLINKYFRLIISLLVALTIPFAFGISTRTSEGDRLLYFPSCFLCMMIAYLFVYFLKTTAWKMIFLSIITVYFIYFLERNNNQWIKASETTCLILDTLKTSPADHLINLPDELEGAFVFRNGFRQSLILNKIDTAKVIVNHPLKRLEYLKIKDTIRASQEKDGLFIFPATRIEKFADTIRIFDDSSRNTATISQKNSAVYYWNKTNLIKLF